MWLQYESMSPVCADAPAPCFFSLHDDTISSNLERLWPQMISNMLRQVYASLEKRTVSWPDTALPAYQIFVRAWPLFALIDRHFNRTEERLYQLVARGWD